MRIAIDAMPLAYTLTGIGVYVQQLIERVHGIDPEHQWVFPIHAEIPSSRFIRRLLRRNLNAADAQRMEIDVRPGWSPFGPARRFAPKRVAHGRAALYHITNAAPLYTHFDCPLIVTIHDLAWLRLDHREQVRFDQANLLFKLVRCAAHVICVSQTTRHDVLDLLKVPDDRVTVTPLAARPGFHPTKDPELATSARDLYASGRPYFLSVSTIEPRKNLVRLVEAFARIRERGTEHRLLLVGAKRSGWPALRDAITKHGLEEVVVPLGRLPDEEVRHLYWGCEALVCPSLYEGFGLPVLEAMACGAPVIAATAGSLPEVGGDAARLVDPYSIDEIADALDAFIRGDGDRERWITAGRQRSGEFTWQRTAQETLRVYQRVVGRE